jgi:diguanylate cyclase (GGDEF)-like protein
MTILIAEDDADSAKYFRKSLMRFEEEILLAKDGNEAWGLILDRPDIRTVIADWRMPGIEGIELCKRVRALSDRPYIYFIMLTGRSDRDDLLASLAAGADDFLTKPVDTAELVGRVNVARRLISAQEELRKKSDELQRLHTELQLQNSQLAELATCDSLTGLKNHRYFRSALDAAVSFSNRKGLPLSLIMLDVDHFKAYNDSFGHPAGDEALIAVARAIRDAVRDHDIVARYGGEEFALLLPATSEEASRIVAERIRAAISSGPWPHRPLHVSVGIATTGGRIATAARLLDAADDALYRAKSLGRDNSVHAEDQEAVKSAKPGTAPRLLKFPTSSD